MIHIQYFMHTNRVQSLGAGVQTKINLCHKETDDRGKLHNEGGGEGGLYDALVNVDFVDWIMTACLQYI